MLRTIHSGIRSFARASRLLAILALGLGLLPAVHAATLDPSVLPRVEAATFEVVAAKPTHDPLSYEKPLPLNLLPYQQRTDKYYSIGTAFAIGNGRYVTAGHVLLIGLGSLWGPPELRDAAGHVYAIDKIEKFSLEKDFVVFTLKHDPDKAALKIDKHPALNQTVYAVGNALGTGIVIRDGLYTSMTPETENGRWKWMRFSAAASPGNSGGPLLDAHGNVIGVVLMKSPNENLNYALPMADVLAAPDHLAEIDKRIGYGFDVFDDSLNNSLKATFALPKTLPDFFAALQKRMQDFSDAQLKALLAKDPSHLFPNGDGSSELLHGVATMGDFPSMIVRNSNGKWSLSGRHSRQLSLDDNGYVTIGIIKHQLLFHLRKPDSVSAGTLYSQPRKLMDLLLKTGFMRRHVGSEAIRVTSLGKPVVHDSHVDKWHRRWQVFIWPVAYINRNMVMTVLPVPDGYVGMLTGAPAADTHDYLVNLEALTDFMYVNYDGTLAQWKDFLKQRDLLPAAFKHIDIDIDYGHRFSYQSGRVHLDVTPKLQKIQPDSVLTLGFSFFKDHGKVVWDVADVWLAAQQHESNVVSILRNEVPAPNMDSDYKDEWNKVLHRHHPYDGVARNDDDVTKITGVVGAPAAHHPAVLYTAYYNAEGTHSQAQMQDKLDLLLKNFKITEPTATTLQP
ncbi:MAG TPA: trypsin-like peptidase domain-containing protein [Rhodanobacteraceae bacterium]|nr:trypsin-like peptidase domain-containing protein [Rhodanobacteraceae bacterium]